MRNNNLCQAHSLSFKQRKEKRRKKEAVLINVSGRYFQTDSSIFERFPDTLLGGGIKDHYYDEKKKEYFFDRDPDLFNYIISYYRTGKLHFPEDECACSFAHELDFFGFSTDHLDMCCHEYFEEQKEESEDYMARKQMRMNQASLQKRVLVTAREKLWEMFDNPGQNLFAMLMHYVSGVFIFISVSASLAETVTCGSEKCGDKYQGFFFVLESICVTLFTIEYLLRLWSTPKRWRFAKQFLSIVDVVAILPFYIGLITPQASEGPFTVLRVFRIFRIVKMSRHSDRAQQAGSSLKKSFSELKFVGVVFIVQLLIFSSIIYYSEYNYENTTFVHIPATFWYTIVTMTTLGYGDMVPESIIGRMTGALCSLSGIMIVAIPAPVLEKNFKNKEDCDELPTAEEIAKEKAKYDIG